jgi:hypothetical protein
MRNPWGVCGTAYHAHMASGAQYEVTVATGSRKTPLLKYRGPVPRVAGLEVQADDQQVRLVYVDDQDPTNGAGVVLDFADNPGGDLTLNRVELDDNLNPTGKPVSKSV